MKKIGALFCLAAIACACGGEGSAEDTEATLASIQDNVFDTSCATSGCHNASSKAGSLDLSSADTSYAQLVGVAAVGEDVGALARVTAGNAADSVLVIRISGTDLGVRMPQGNAVLPEKAIAAITQWINDGAKK